MSAPGDTYACMNAARALRFARRRAGLTQTELARRAGVPVSVVNRIERGGVTPRVDTLQRILQAAGATLTIEARKGSQVERGPIRDLLRTPPRGRLGAAHIEALDELCRRRVRFVVIGNAAARLHGAPIRVAVIEVVVRDDHLNLRRLERARRSAATAGLVAHGDVGGGALWRDAEELPWLPVPKMRVLNDWLDAPSGLLASIDSLLGSSSPELSELLHAVQEEVDLLSPGHRIYRDAESRMQSLPPPRRRYRGGSPGGGTVRNMQI